MKLYKCEGADTCGFITCQHNIEHRKTDTCSWNCLLYKLYKEYIIYPTCKEIISFKLEDELFEI